MEPSEHQNPQALAEDTTAVVLAGGRGERLGPLTRHQCKPALPFGGLYRSIDFSLSNCVNSGVTQIGVPTQYRDASLVRHLEHAWLAGSSPAPARIDVWRAAALADSAGYRGTADAVYRNWGAIEAFGRRLVLVLAGDHVYRMDYRPMLLAHVAGGADVTVGCIEVPIAEARQFGVMTVDGTNRIRRFSEKPARPEAVPGRPGRALGSMGIYVFDRDLLGRLLRTDARSADSTHDFGRDLIPRLVAGASALAYPFTEHVGLGAGYWRDVGTTAAFWRAHLELLDGIPGLDLAGEDWPVLPFDRLGRPARARAWAAARRNGSLLAHGSIAGGASVSRSVVCGGARVGPGSELVNAVVLPRASIGEGCRLVNVIVDAGVRVPAGTVVEAARHRFGIVEPVLLSVDTDFAALAGAPGAEPTALRRAH
ncbi:MAG: glucose-1-phosphate adenylyltransferase [Gammaproteobacteria bacterium]|nr:glucose-1-phosphate adenylyltransferase [Gammaproteobacteria bacterium]|tara:strand:+ start:11146 stop:12417 length:1272 start_codon:yes stop_codon:yes gene_type:complete